MMVNAFAAQKAGSELTAFEYELGELPARDVDIDVQYCGICHSDLSMIDNEWGLSDYPLVAGHEVVGVVAKVGSQVKNLHVGDVVGLGWQSGSCLHCHHCEMGDQNLCAEAQGTIIQRHGGFADKVRAQASSVVKLPDGIDLESAGPLFCGGITVFNPLVQFDIKPTDNVAVIGIGGLGHLALQFLNAWGCEVTAFTSSESKKEEVLSLGAHHALNTNNVKDIERSAGQFDFILSTVNVALDWNVYINALSARGRLHFVGVLMDTLDIGVFGLISQQRSISGSPVGSPSTMRQMVDFAKKHNIKPVIETFAFKDINEALTRLRSGEVRYRIVLHH